MQGLVAEIAQGLRQFFAGSCRYCEAAAINGIADQGMAQVSEMHANLVGAPGLEVDPDMAMPAKPFDHAVMGDRIPAPGSNGHFPTVVPVAIERLVHGPARGQHAQANGLILAGNLPARQHIAELLLDFGIAGDQQQTAGTLVQPVDDPRPWQRFESRVKIQQGIDQGAIRVAGARVHDQPDRLVDHQEIIALVHYLQRDMLWPIDGPRLQGLANQHLLATRQLLSRASRLAIQQYIAALNPLLDAAPRKLRKQSGQDLVQTVTCLIRRYYQIVYTAFCHCIPTDVAEPRAVYGILRGPAKPAGNNVADLDKGSSGLFMDSHLAPMNRPELPIIRCLTALMLAATLSGCGGSPKQVDPNLGAIKLYEKARQSMVTGNYGNAIMRFERLEGRYPFSNHTKQAQLDIIFCYYMNREPDAAVDAADQFILENPTHPRVDYANYIKGLVFFPKKPNRLFRLFKVDPTERPPRSAQTSFNNFHYLVTNFPDSPYVANARQRMIYLQNYLARYEIHVARYYMERGAYVAALKRAQNVMIEYQGTTSVADALGVMIDAYEKLDLHEMAQQTRDVLRLNTERLEVAMSSTD